MRSTAVPREACDQRGEIVHGRNVSLRSGAEKDMKLKVMGYHSHNYIKEHLSCILIHLRASSFNAFVSASFLPASCNLPFFDLHPWKT